MSIATWMETAKRISHAASGGNRIWSHNSEIVCHGGALRAWSIAANTALIAVRRHYLHGGRDDKLALRYCWTVRNSGRFPLPHSIRNQFGG